MLSVTFALYIWTCTTYRYNMSCEWQWKQNFVSEQECKNFGELLSVQVKKDDGKPRSEVRREYRCMKKTNP